MSATEQAVDLGTGERLPLPDPTAPPVQVALAAAAAAVGAIPKDDMNQDQGFKYRGIERILAGVGPALHRAGVVVLPRVLNVHREEMLRGANKNVWRLVTLTVEYLFVGPRGDSLSAVVLGEGLDNGDKAVSKAMTMAYKAALLQALQIADADTDPDATSPPAQVREDAPAPVAFLSSANQAAVQAKATEAGLSADEVGEMVMVATGDRTAVLAEVYANEVRALRDAMQTVLSRKTATPEMGERSAFLAQFDALHEKVQAKVDRADTKPVSPAKRTRLILDLKALGVESDEDQRAVLSTLIGRTVRSRSDLTASQADAVLDVLAEEAADPVGQP